MHAAWVYLGCTGLLLVVMACLICLWLPVRVTLRWSQQQRDTEARISVRYLFGLVHVEKQLWQLDSVLTREGPALHAVHSPPKKRGRTKAERTWLTSDEVFHILREWPVWSRVFSGIWRSIRHTLRRTHVEQLHWQTTIGTGDAASTGMACGAVWAAMGSVFGRLSHLTQCHSIPRMRVQPDFQTPQFRTELECIAWIRAGHAILGAVGVVRAWRRRKVWSTRFKA
ncbi:MAG: DUF2953 domain-containing protein [Alicyclobacillus sp.]|nr:DUF2953 domain-containing protein [Alicyclobacillus sp.]